VKFKKLFLTLLTAVFILQSVNICSFEARADSIAQGDVSFTNALSLEGTIGILDGIEQKSATDTVTRGEFTALLMRAIGCSDDGSASPYSDVERGTSFADEIICASQMNIAGGIGGGLFAPDDAIEGVHAVKMVVTAMNYEPMARAFGGYPSGYQTVADRLDILDDVASPYGSNLTWRDAAVLVYNVLKCDILQVESIIDGDITYTRTKGESLLTKVFDLSCVSGVVRTADTYSMRIGYRYSEPTVDVDGVVLKCAVAGCEQYLGMSADVWYNTDSKTAVCVLPDYNNRFASLNPADCEYNAGVLTIYNEDNNKEVKYNLSSDYSYVKNGRLSAVEDIEFGYEGGTLSLVDNNGDGRYDVVLASRQEVMIVQSIDRLTGLVFDSADRPFGKDRPLSLSADDGYCVKLELSDGASTVPADADSLEVGMVISVYASSDDSLVRAVISTKQIKGKIEEISGDDYVINGETYSIGDYFKNYCAAPVSGVSYVFKTDAEGYIADCEVSGGAMKYGYLIGVAFSGGLENQTRLKILTSGNSKEVYTTAEKVKLDGITVSKDSDDFKSAILNGSYPKYQLIRYMETDGVIKAIDTLEEAPSGRKTDGSEYTLDERYSDSKSYDNSLTRYVKQELIWYRSGGQASPYFVFDGSTKIFSVPKALLEPGGENGIYNDDQFRVTNNNWAIDTRDKRVDAYDYDDSFYPAAVVAYTMSGGTGGAGLESPTASSNPEIVEKVSSVITSEGEKTVKIYTYNGSVFKRRYIDPELLADFEASSLIPAPGDIIRVSTDMDGYLNGIAIDTRYNGVTMQPELSSAMTSTGMFNLLSYIKGTAYSHSSGTVSLCDAETPTIDTIEVPDDGLYVFRVASGRPVILFDTQTQTARPASMDDIIDARAAGEAGASTLCIRLAYGEVQTVFIYKK